MIIHRQRLFDFGTYIVILSMRSFFNSALALKGSCEVVGPEIPEYQVQGEAVIIRFPFLEDAINYRNLQVDHSSTFHIDHTNLRNQSSLKSCRDRVKQSGRGVQLLPSHPSDSGTFTYTLRSNTFCLTGSISVTIYEAEEPNTMMTYNAHVGEDTKINCPHLRYFTRKENLMWYKDFQSTALPVGRGQYTIESGIILSIRNMSVKDQGFYTCRLNVIFNNTRYNVSRTWRVRVSAPESESAAPEVVTSNNLNAFTSSSYSFPYIVFPVNGSFIESHVGSRLEISCTVSVGKPSAQSTDVTWLVNGHPVENSHLGGRAFKIKGNIHVCSDPLGNCVRNGLKHRCLRTSRSQILSKVTSQAPPTADGLCPISIVSALSESYTVRRRLCAGAAGASECLQLDWESGLKYYNTAIVYYASHHHNKQAVGQSRLQCLIAIHPFPKSFVLWRVVGMLDPTVGEDPGEMLSPVHIITGNHLEVQLVILELQQEDNWTELKCICQNQDQKQEVVAQIKLEDSEPLWLVIAAIASCFILVVCVFLYHLCQKPQKQGDYIQARQDSTI
ncbi:interleukin-1 receptor type 2-like [Megalobrama amblycephala]|uniref:interleukin-1 receptor type 2-like n=1 Tax=Megalobrama amblycephala TaxID=75352 RepID=UPI00201443ED|nr:interleukin-1 receptor type 2-like [Megalobrama amblycephala]